MAANTIAVATFSGNPAATHRVVEHALRRRKDAANRATHPLKGIPWIPPNSICAEA